VINGDTIAIGAQNLSDLGSISFFGEISIDWNGPDTCFSANPITGSGVLTATIAAQLFETPVQVDNLSLEVHYRKPGIKEPISGAPILQIGAIKVPPDCDRVIGEQNVESGVIGLLRTVPFYASYRANCRGSDLVLCADKSEEMVVTQEKTYWEVLEVCPSGGLSIGVIAGIAGGAVAIIGGITVVICLRRKPNRPRNIILWDLKENSGKGEDRA
jgi:hypothetical protein